MAAASTSDSVSVDIASTLLSIGQKRLREDDEVYEISDHENLSNKRPRQKNIYKLHRMINKIQIKENYKIMVTFIIEDVFSGNTHIGFRPKLKINKESLPFKLSKNDFDGFYYKEGDIILPDDVSDSVKTEVIYKNQLVNRLEDDYLLNSLQVKIKKKIGFLTKFTIKKLGDTIISSNIYPLLKRVYIDQFITGPVRDGDPSKYNFRNEFKDFLE